MQEGHRDGQRALLAAAAALCPTAVFLTDADGRCEAVNAKWCELMGAPSEAALGDGWMALVHPEDRAGFVGAWWAALQGVDDWNCSCRIRRPDGTEAAMKVTATAVLDTSGGTAGWIGQVALDEDGDETWVAAEHAWSRSLRAGFRPQPDRHGADHARR